MPALPLTCTCSMGLWVDVSVVLIAARVTMLAGEAATRRVGKLTMEIDNDACAPQICSGSCYHCANGDTIRKGSCLHANGLLPPLFVSTLRPCQGAASCTSAFVYKRLRRSRAAHVLRARGLAAELKFADLHNADVKDL